MALPPQGAAAADTKALAAEAAQDTERLLAEALRLQGEHKEREAIDCLYEAFRRDLEPLAKAQLHTLMGNGFARLSELEEAEGRYQQALAAARQADSREGEAAALGSLGLIYEDRGDLVRAEDHHQQALLIDRDIGNRLGEANQLGNLGLMAARRENQDEACRLLGGAAAIYHEIGAAQELEKTRDNLQALGCDEGS